MTPQIHHNVSLRHRTTFHVDVTARYWAALSSVEELAFFYRNPKWAAVPKLILSGGSNVLFRNDFPGLVLHPAIRGIDVIEEDAHTVCVRVGAGESWDDFVAHAVERCWHGVENLSWIPGCVGTAPVQNIGAYGVEVKDAVDRVEYWSRDDGRPHCIEKDGCRFAYRDSIFKHDLKDRAVITRVVFRLSRKASFTLDYPDLKAALLPHPAPDLSAVREAVVSIRKRKLPDPSTLGNAGSFFKNPDVDPATFDAMKTRHPGLPGFRHGTDRVKIPAGWLIEQCGWKGFRDGDAGVHPGHALVLVNYGGATGEEIWSLALRIQRSVLARFGIELVPEVTVL